MTTPDDELDKLESAILSAMSDPAIDERIPDWTTAHDLTRIGIEAMLDTQKLGRVLVSRGNIHISGAGFRDSSARVNDLARVMTGFQRLATAVGASQVGDKELGKQPTADVQRRTDLLLSAATSPESIALTFTPAITPNDELGDPGMLAELESDDQMLDTAVGAAIDVLAAGNDIGLSPLESAFVDLLGTLGPRAAAAVRDLAKTLDRARFDIDIAWQQPTRTTRRVHVSAGTAARIATTVEHTNLDEQPVTIIGEYLTVSAVTSWLIKQDDGDTITVKLGRIDPAQIKGLAVGDRIRIEATMKTETVTGGNAKTTYTAKTFERLDHAE